MIIFSTIKKRVTMRTINEYGKLPNAITIINNGILQIGNTNTNANISDGLTGDNIKHLLDIIDSQRRTIEVLIDKLIVK